MIDDAEDYNYSHGPCSNMHKQPSTYQYEDLLIHEWRKQAKHQPINSVN